MVRRDGSEEDRGAAAGRSLTDIKHMPDLSCLIYLESLVGQDVCNLMEMRFVISFLLRLVKFNM